MSMNLETHRRRRERWNCELNPQKLWLALLRKQASPQNPKISLRQAHNSSLQRQMVTTQKTQEANSQKVEQSLALAGKKKKQSKRF